MADNYLEKRMDDYSRGRLGRSRSAASSSGLRCIKIPRAWAFVIKADGRELLLKALREAGYRVAFTLADSSAGQTLAQSTGARFYPCSASEALAQLEADDDPIAGILVPTVEDLHLCGQLATRHRAVLLDSPSTDGIESIAGHSPSATALRAIAAMYPED